MQELSRNFKGKYMKYVKKFWKQ